MAQRKIQGEIERTIKKLNEGLDLFDEIHEKVINAENHAQREKTEHELKKELKKLQRLREKVKTYISTTDFKDKSNMVGAKKAVERRMETFKNCEKETKSKSYTTAKSEKQQKMKRDKMRFNCDNKEKNQTMKMMDNWKKELQEKIDDCENDIEQEQEEKKPDVDSIETNKDRIEKHQEYIDNIEQVMDLLFDDIVSVNDVEEIKVDIEYYITDHQEPEFYENEIVFDAIWNKKEAYEKKNKEEENAVVEDPEVAASTITSVKEKSKKKQTQQKVAPSAGSEIDLSNLVNNTIQTKIIENKKTKVKKQSTKSTNKSSISSSATSNSQPKNLSYSNVASKSKPSSTERNDTDNEEYENENEENISETNTSETPSLSTKSRDQSPTIQDSQNRYSQDNENNEFEKDNDQNQMILNSQSSIMGNQTPEEISRPGSLGENNSLNNMNLTPQQQSQLAKMQQQRNTEMMKTMLYNREMKILNYAFKTNTITSQDTEKPSQYKPANPVEIPSDFPSTPLRIFNDPLLVRQFDADTLFFMFYLQKDTYQQYLAAKELKRQAWRYHKKYSTWFQRHKQPTETTQELEKGTYVYFDFEEGWCQRIKEKFEFRYDFFEKN